MTSTDWLLVLIVVVLFLFSIVLALSEMAFSRMNRIRALALEEEGKRGAAKLARMLERPEQTINSLLLLVLIAQLTSASLIGVILERQVGAIGLGLGLVLQVVFFFVIGEAAPKTWAIQHTDRAALLVSGFLFAITNVPPLRALSRGLIQLANLILPGHGLKEGPFVTEDDLRTMADVAADEEVIEREERRLIHSIFEFGDTVVREVMVPRPDMVAIEADATIEAAIEAAIEAGYSRIPAYEETTDDIVGLVYLKDLVQRARAGGIDEHGGTAGIVTLEDLLEEIVGEIVDEYDVEEPGVEPLPDGSLRVPGRTAIDEVSEVLGVELPDTEWDTVGGLVFNLLGHVPDEGETVRFQDLEFRTERVQGRRIVSVRISHAAPTDTDRPRVADTAPPG
jgi:putative hemolysin